MAEPRARIARRPTRGPRPRASRAPSCRAATQDAERRRVRASDPAPAGPVERLRAVSRRPPRRCATATASAPSPTLERPPRAEFGDYSTNVALLLAPALKAPPREIAERVGAS